MNLNRQYRRRERAPEAGFFESKAVTLDYARQVDDLIEQLNGRVSEARAASTLNGFPFEDWVDFRRTWGIFRDDLFNSWITYGMHEGVANYHRQLTSWKRLFEKLTGSKAISPNVP